MVITWLLLEALISVVDDYESSILISMMIMILLVVFVVVVDHDWHKCRERNDEIYNRAKMIDAIIAGDFAFCLSLNKLELSAEECGNSGDLMCKLIHFYTCNILCESPVAVHKVSVVTFLCVVNALGWEV